MTGKLISQLVPSMANQWSHPHGKTSPKVVPSRWQTTWGFGLVALTVIRVGPVLKVVTAVLGERRRPIGPMTTHFEQAPVVESASGDPMRPVAVHVGRAALAHPRQNSHLDRVERNSASAHPLIIAEGKGRQRAGIVVACAPDWSCRNRLVLPTVHGRMSPGAGGPAA